VRCFLIVFVLGCVGAQTPSAPKVPSQTQWRRNVSGIISRPPAKATARDIERLEQYMVNAMPYCTSLDPNDYEANRELARQMAAYAATVNTLAQDAGTRAAAIRLSRSVAVFPCAPPPQSSQAPPAAEPAPASQPSEPPFSLKAPAIENVPDRDKQTAAELQARYEADAGRAAAAWRNTERMTENLVARGMTLNAETTKSALRLQLFFGHAMEALRAHDWAEARSNLEAIESDTEKIFKVVGR
jgi:hypothetical protein